MTTLQRAFKTELDLNDRQVTACKQHAGAARWAYNWGLVRKQEVYQATGKAPSAIDLHRELNTLKQTTVPWMYTVSKCAPQEALRNLDQAFAHFFRRAKLKRQGHWRGKLGHPQRKTRKRGLGSFRLTGSIIVFPGAIQLPRLGQLRLKERGYLPTDAHILSATVSEQAGHWYVSVLVEQEQDVPDNTGPVVGVDLGVKTLATLSDGTVVPNPRHLRSSLKRLKRCQHAVSRKQQGSHNRRKAVHRLARLHRRVAHQRANTLHQLTTRLAKTKSVVVIEDLNISGLLKNHHLAQAIGDVGWAEFRRQLTYKAAWYGCRVVVVSRWEPSSKRCSGCGHVKETLSLAERVYRCAACGLVLDRDLNAAINLSQLADSSSDSRNACGEASAGLGVTTQVKLAPMKQEPNTIYGLSTDG
jgi:putative transposase